jgi:hypothetical protein
LVFFPSPPTPLPKGEGSKLNLLAPNKVEVLAIITLDQLTLLPAVHTMLLALITVLIAVLTMAMARALILKQILLLFMSVNTMLMSWLTLLTHDDPLTLQQMILPLLTST